MALEFQSPAMENAAPGSALWHRLGTCHSYKRSISVLSPDLRDRICSGPGLAVQTLESKVPTKDTRP